MSKAKIDINKAIEMRIKGSTLEEIGSHFSATSEGVRQAFQRAEKKKREQKKLARLLVSASVDDKVTVKNSRDIAKTIDDWAAILDAAKKGIALEAEVADLRNRLSHIEKMLSLPENKKEVKT